MASGLVVYAVAWVWGGRPERYGAGVLLFVCLLSGLTYEWEVAGVYPAALAQESVRLLIFGWLGLRSDRWWPLAITAPHALMVLIYVLRLVNPAFSHDAMASAHVGLSYLIDLILLFGVWERWLAGEPAAGPAAWAAAARNAEARRNRRVDAPDRPQGSRGAEFSPSGNHGRNRPGLGRRGTGLRRADMVERAA